MPSENSLSYRSGILPGAKFSLHPILALSYFDSVTAQHCSSGRQPNFAALSRGRHLYLAGRPSRWALAHILVLLFIYIVLQAGIRIIPLRNVQANWCRWCSRYRTLQRTSGLTGDVTSTCRTIVDVSTTPLTSAAEETVRSFSTCVVHWRRRTSSSSTFQLYNCWQMHLRNCLWWQTFFYLLVVFRC